MKIIMVMAVAALVAGGVSASLVESWQFNDDIETELNVVANAGSGGTAWNFAMPAEGTVDGAGSLAIGDDPLTANQAVSKDWTRKATFASAITTGTFVFETKYSAWNLTQTVGNGIIVKVGGTGANTVNLVFDWRATDNIRTRHAVAGLTGTAKQKGALLDSGSDLVVRLSGNLDTGAFTTSYNLGGTGFTDLITDGGGLTSISEVLVAVEGTTAWSAGEYVGVDYMQLDVIPEPATLGLVAAFGAGIMFVRRRFMI